MRTNPWISLIEPLCCCKVHANDATFCCCCVFCFVGRACSVGVVPSPLPLPSLAFRRPLGVSLSGRFGTHIQYLVQ